ncbi:MAG TPA: sigma-54-dependent Fis family transcriptional regulator, partial [Desulfobulbaceae bacterium]|nr:sigma-54-dependent Fis family transcriptional regulator [Desulfobulbaceae bacterium]
GNVRELKNALQTGIILCQGNRIEPEDLQLDDEPDSFDQFDDDFTMEQSEKEAIIR